MKIPPFQSHHMKILYILAEELLGRIFKVLLVTHSSPPTTAFL